MSTSRILGALVLAASLVAAVPARGEPALLIILGGGKKPADAEDARREWLEAWQGRRTPPLLARAGWPRTMSSEDVPGLNPGFHVAALGVCPVDQAAIASFARTLRVGLYNRRVEWTGPMACPGLDQGYSQKQVGTFGGSGSRVLVTEILYELQGVNGPFQTIAGVSLEVDQANGRFLEERAVDPTEGSHRLEVRPDSWAIEEVRVGGDRLEAEVFVEKDCFGWKMVAVARVEKDKLVLEWRKKPGGGIVCGD